MIESHEFIGDAGEDVDGYHESDEAADSGVTSYHRRRNLVHTVTLRSDGGVKGVGQMARKVGKDWSGITQVLSRL